MFLFSPLCSALLCLLKCIAIVFRMNIDVLGLSPFLCVFLLIFSATASFLYFSWFSVPGSFFFTSLSLALNISRTRIEVIKSLRSLSLTSVAPQSSLHCPHTSHLRRAVSCSSLIHVTHILMGLRAALENIFLSDSFLLMICFRLLEKSRDCWNYDNSFVID